MQQKQVLAPRMIQSMEILQLPLMALEERIEQEIQNNETLEVEEAEEDTPSGEPAAPVSDAQQQAADRTVDEKPLVVDQDHANQADFERSYDWSNEYPDSDDDRSRPSATRVDEASDRYLDAMANMQERPETLCNHLHDQIKLFTTWMPMGICQCRWRNCSIRMDQPTRLISSLSRSMSCRGWILWAWPLAT